MGPGPHEPQEGAQAGAIVVRVAEESVTSFTEAAVDWIEAGAALITVGDDLALLEEAHGGGAGYQVPVLGTVVRSAECVRLSAECLMLKGRAPGARGRRH